MKESGELIPSCRTRSFFCGIERQAKESFRKDILPFMASLPL